MIAVCARDLLDERRTREDVGRNLGREGGREEERETVGEEESWQKGVADVGVASGLLGLVWESQGWMVNRPQFCTRTSLYSVTP